MDESGNLTYVEEFLSTVELLPVDIKRDCELMRILDSECNEIVAEITKAEADTLEYINTNSTGTVTSTSTSSSSTTSPETKPLTLSPTSTSTIQSKLAHIAQLRAKLRSKLANKTAIACNLNQVVESYTKKLDSDLALFEADLRGCGEFTVASALEPGSEVAIRPSHIHPEWILGRVLYYYSDMGAYDVVDIDGDTRALRLPETQVIGLDSSNIEAIRRLSKNDEVLAVYPDTSTFYPAVLAQAPKRAVATAAASGGSSGNGYDLTVLVQFHGDEGNELGQIPFNTVPLRHIIKPPAAWS